MNGNELDLPGLPDSPRNEVSWGYFGAGPTENETRQSIADLEAENPFTPRQRAIKQLCVSLAVSIDKGNAKGRAIAPEVSQLFELLEQLAPPAEAGADESALSPELRKLFDALAAPAQLDPAPQGDAA